MTIDRGAGTPPWMQLAAILRAQIRAGQLAPGQRLPSERYIADEHGVALATVRKALAQLREEGLVVTAAGWGSSVAPPDGHGGPPAPDGGGPP